ncbi:MAG: hypothetical protein AB1798_07490 [Spirochaetota bacterium]
MSDEALKVSLAFIEDSEGDQGIELFEDPAVDTTISLPPICGEGTIRSLSANDDIGFMIVKHTPNPDWVTVNHVVNKPALKIGYLLKTGEAYGWHDGMQKKHIFQTGNPRDQFRIGSH